MRPEKMYTMKRKKDVEVNRNSIRDQKKPKIPRDHEDDVPAKDASNEYDDKTPQKLKETNIAPLVSQKQQKPFKTEDPDKFDKFIDEKSQRQENEKNHDKFDKFTNEKTQREEGNNKYEKFDKYIDEKTQKEEDKYEEEDSAEEQLKKDYSRENSGHETQKFRRFSTIKRPVYDRGNRATETESDEALGLEEATEKPQTKALLNKYFFARAGEDNTDTKTTTPTTTKERNEFDQYDSFKTKPVSNFYLAQKETNAAPEPENVTPNDTTVKLSDNNVEVKLKDPEDITEAPENLSDENVKFSKHQDSVESDTNYDAFSEDKQPVLESVLSNKLQGKPLATSGDLLLGDPHSETPWWEKDLVTGGPG